MGLSKIEKLSDEEVHMQPFVCEHCNKVHVVFTDLKQNDGKGYYLNIGDDDWDWLIDQIHKLRKERDGVH